MLIINYGMPKTGSTLLFELTKVTLESCGQSQELVTLAQKTGETINFTDDLREPALSQFQRAAADRLLVVKTHTPLTDYVIAEYAAKRLDVMIAIRDPRDVALSMLDHGERARAAGRDEFSKIRTIVDAARIVDRRSRQAMEWIRMAPDKVYRYEEFVEDLEGAVARIAGQFGLRAEPRDVLPRMRGRFTQLNKGVVNRHKTELDAEHQALVKSTAPLLFESFYSVEPPPQ